jgi:beta-carotene 3-hydroxylase
VAMEPISAAVHRFFGHGPGWRLHRSHHESPVRGPELNDVIPAVSALLTMALFAVGMWRPGWGWLVPVAAGATAYGAVYFTVHDLYIHRRLPLLPSYVGWLEPFKQAHLLHHRTGTGHWGIFARPTPGASPAAPFGPSAARVAHQDHGEHRHRS